MAIQVPCNHRCRLIILVWYQFHFGAYTVIFMDHGFQKATNIKLILCVFEQLSGLKINFHKSELFFFGEAKQYNQEYAQLFGCKIGTYPFRYLGILMHTKKLGNKEWQAVEDRFEKKLSGSKGKLLSVGGRLVLINSVLPSLPMFMVSFFEVPKGMLEEKIPLSKVDCGVRAKRTRRFRRY